LRLDELKRNGFPCLECANNKTVPAGGGSFAVGIECKLLNYQLWIADKEKIQNCKNFITYEQKERKDKLDKIKEIIDGNQGTQ
jgi:hypothetical protein